MERLKIGDIRKFKDGVNDVTGVIIDINDNGYLVFDIYGEKKIIHRISSFSIPHLKPEIRDYLKEIGNTKAREKELQEEVNRLHQEISRCEGKYRSLVSNFKEYQMGMPKESFTERLKKVLGDKYTEMCKRGYKLNVKANATSVFVSIYKSYVIAEYATPEKVPYLEYGFNDNIEVKRYDYRYTDAISQEEKNCLIFKATSPIILTDIKDIIVDSQGTLIFNHDVQFMYLKGNLNEESLNVFVKGIHIER